jgi:hypothetical protein
MLQQGDVAGIHVVEDIRMTAPAMFALRVFGGVQSFDCSKCWALSSVGVGTFILR